jgi:hypothetical protein
METDIDRALWNVVDKRSYKKQHGDAQRCVDSGANVNCQRPVDPYGNDLSNCETPLTRAVALGTPKLVKRLLELGADPSATTGTARTVLHIAALNNRPQVVRMLLNAGVSTENKDTIYGWTALHIAVFQCNRDHATVRMLLAYGANVNAVDDTGHTPLDIMKEYEQRYSPELKEILLASAATYQPWLRLSTGSIRTGTGHGNIPEAEPRINTLLKK